MIAATAAATVRDAAPRLATEGVPLPAANWQQAAGVGVAGLACLARKPMLVAVVLGIAATAALRLWA